MTSAAASRVDDAPLRLGYKASAEQFGPRQLLEYAVLAEQLGFDSVAVSDHFQPWRHSSGHAPYALGWLTALGERTSRVLLGTSVLTPTLRYNPAVIAQAVGTLAELNPGRVFLGVGTGEAMNEVPATGLPWPSFRERSERLEEAVTLIRRLWSQERVSFEGKYYRTALATIYDKPSEPVPVYFAAGGPKAARLAGRLADGFICTSGKRSDLYRELLDNLAAGAGDADRDPASIDRYIEVKISYDHDLEFARDACRWWAALGLTGEEKTGIGDPLELERTADEHADRAHSRFIVAANPEAALGAIQEYLALGFTHLVFHAPGHDQERFLTQFSSDVLPLLRER